MNKRAKSRKWVLSGLFALSVGAFASVYGESWPYFVHALILTPLAVGFSIADFFLRGLLGNLSSLSSFSHFNSEQTRRLMDKIKVERDRLTWVWFAMILLKTSGAVCGTLLFRADLLAPGVAFAAMVVGYTVIAGSLPLTLWVFRYHRYVQELHSKFKLEEKLSAEREKLLGQIGDGSDIDYSNDPHMLSLTDVKDWPPGRAVKVGD